MPKRSSSSKPKFYAVAVGRQPGIYESWDDCYQQVNKYSQSKYKSFVSRQEATQYLKANTVVGAEDGSNNNNNNNGSNKRVKTEHTEEQQPPPPPAAAAAAATSTNDAADAFDATTVSTAASIPLHFSIDTLPDLTCTDSSTIIEFHMNFDGGSRGNGFTGSEAGCGTHIVTKLGTRRRYKTDIRHYLTGGKTRTNNQAEYIGCMDGLQYIYESLLLLKERQTSATAASPHSPPQSISIVVQGDSKLVINQIQGIYQCKSSNLHELYDQTIQIIKRIESLRKVSLGGITIVYEHVYRKDNSVADGK
jgi:ribonuclease HI